MSTIVSNLNKIPITIYELGRKNETIGYLGNYYCYITNKFINNVLYLYSNSYLCLPNLSILVLITTKSKYTIQSSYI